MEGKISPGRGGPMKGDPRQVSTWERPPHCPRLGACPPSCGTNISGPRAHGPSGLLERQHATNHHRTYGYTYTRYVCEELTCQRTHAARPCRLNLKQAISAQPCTSKRGASASAWSTNFVGTLMEGAKARVAGSTTSLLRDGLNIRANKARSFTGRSQDLRGRLYNLTTA